MAVRYRAIERRDVDQLDHGRDHHRGQGRLGQVLEQAGQEQQGEDGEGGHDQPRHLRPGPGAAVHGGLGEAAVDHHAAGQARPQVGGAEAEQLPVGVDLVVVPGRIGLGRAQPFGEADQHHPGRGRGQLQVVGRGHLRRPQRRQAAVDLPDDLDAVGVQVEERPRPRSRGGRRPATRARPGRSAAAPAPAPARPGRRPGWSRWSGRGWRAGPRASRRSRHCPCRRRTGPGAARRRWSGRAR